MADNQKYRITERIDAGGMAEVYRGVAESLQGFKKNVAIKRILPNLTKNKKFISMFLDEARLSLHLQHANIVGVFDIGQAPPEAGNPGAYFIVMEFVDGSHLKGIVEHYRKQGKALRVAHVIYILMEVCKGLAYAHEIGDPETGRPLGIVHRDISPPNILISKMGEVKLVDFGLAKATSQLESTDPGVVKGKFSYLSPEAAMGQEVDRRADIFAVGILLYELLTGKRLFYGETDYQTVELVRAARVPSVMQQNPEVEPELESVVRKALAKDVEQRYQTAGELQDALAQYLFSRALKVTSRDIAQIVQDVVRERQASAPPQKPKSLIDELIQDELVKFTSLEEVNEPSPTGEPTGDDASRPLDAGSFVDTRAWVDEDPTISDAQLPLVGRAQLSAGGGATAGASGRPGLPGLPGLSAGPPRVAVPIEPSGVKSLEKMREGEASVSSSQKREPTQVVNKPRGKGGGMGLWIAVVALLLVGGAAAFYFVTHH